MRVCLRLKLASEPVPTRSHAVDALVTIGYPVVNLRARNYG